MKILFLGDVGGTRGYHLGDEALAEAAVLELSARIDLEPVLVTGDLEDTGSRYGWSVVPRLSFLAGAGLDEERDATLAAVLRAADGESSALSWDDPAWEVIHAVAEADGVVICGGGNLNSFWPEHVYERAAVAMLAARFNTPLVVSGQTVGPVLSGRHGELTARIVTGGRVAAARESASAATLAALGVPAERLVTVADDATFLPAETALDVPERRFILASFAGHLGSLADETLIARFAGVVGHAATAAGADVLLVGHHGADEPGGDGEIHRRIAELLPMVRVDVVDGASARRVVALTRAAHLVISSRYHAFVFALGNAVPALAFAVDDYTTRKLLGAAAQYGVGDLVLPAMAAATDLPPRAIDDLIRGHDGLVAHLTNVGAIRRAEQVQWWDHVHSIFDPAAPAVLPPGQADAPHFSFEDWAGDSARLREWAAVASSRLAEASITAELLRAESQRNARKADEFRRASAELAAELDEQYRHVAELRCSLEASHELMAESVGPALARIAELPRTERLQRRVTRLSAELESIRKSRSYRLMSGPGRAYGRLRRMSPGVRARQ